MCSHAALTELLRFGKRDKEDRAPADTERSNEPDPASTLIIAGEPIPRGNESPAADQQATTDSEAESQSRRLAEVIEAKRKNRWQPPELEGPDFGGLIERRGVDTRGLMPQKFEEEVVEEHRQESAPTPGDESSQVAAAADSDTEESLESRGMFLASLDNSAITLADSGLFKVTDAAEEESEAPDGSFNPYNHRG